LYALTKDDLNGICKLMGPVKGRNLTQALLTRNLRSWHTFDEIEGIGKDWDETETRQDKKKKKMLERRGSSVFPWSTPNHSGEHTAAAPNASGAAKHRRRRSSQQRLTFSLGTTMEAAVGKFNDEEMC
jgi:hypothetical protein